MYCATQVMSHLEQVGRDAGEQTLANWPSSAGSVEDVFGRILTYLSAQVWMLAGSPTSKELASQAQLRQAQDAWV